MAALFAELKRRKVFRTARLYGYVAGPVLATSTFFWQAFEMPIAVLRFVAIIAIAGFPLALTLSWFFEVKREVHATSDHRRWHDYRSVGLGLAASTIAFVLLSLLTGNTTSRPASLCIWHDTIPTKVRTTFPPERREISCTLRDVPVREFLTEVADSAGYTLFVGPGVTGTVTATIDSMSWELALLPILRAHRLTMTSSDLQKVMTVQSLDSVGPEPRRTASYRLKYAKAAQVAEKVEALLSDSGRVTFDELSNSLLVVETNRVHADVLELIDLVDLPPDDPEGIRVRAERRFRRETVKGKLIWPIAASANITTGADPSVSISEPKVIYEFGREALPGGYVVFHYGIGIQALGGTHVRAVLGGRIVLSGPFENYQTSIIINHGNGLYSVYGLLAQVAPGVREGVEIRVGETIGSLGDPVDGENPHLEFQIRAPADDNPFADAPDSRPVPQNPLIWLRPGPPKAR